MENIPTPNKKIIEEYLINWDNLEEHYIWQESSLDKLFHKDYKSTLDLFGSFPLTLEPDLDHLDRMPLPDVHSDL